MVDRLEPSAWVTRAFAVLAERGDEASRNNLVAALERLAMPLIERANCVDAREVLEEIRGIHEGGGFGSIIGRNSFQRSRADGSALLQKVMDVYKS